MIKIVSRPLPERAILGQHCASGDYVDCLTADTPISVELPAFISAFYSSPAFWLERKALELLLNKGADHDDIAALARGQKEQFAAWNIEHRSEEQLLMRDYQGRTRSWLMVEKCENGGTRLYFGTSVNRKVNGGLFARSIFWILLPLHKVYARTLLRSAMRGVNKAK